jgi:Tfp pilus assembly protein PilP
MALITSKKSNIAMIRAKNGEEFFIRVNDTLGNADGKITSINKRGIEVTEKDKVVSLLVRNRGVNNDKN